MKVTKKQIIQAIQTEPLRSGQWIFMNDEGTNGKSCPVCAVGAVLRRAGIDPRFLDDVATSNARNAAASRIVYISNTDGEETQYDFHTAPKKLKQAFMNDRIAQVKTDPLGALSSLFEELGESFTGTYTSPNGNEYTRWNPNRLQQTRKILTEFVKNHFPKTVWITTTT